MLVNEDLIILKLKTIERHFGFEDVIRSQANATISIVESIAFLEDIQQLAELTKDISTAKKLMRIKQSPVLSITSANIIKFIKEHPELSGRIGFNETETRITLKTKVSKRLFIKLLNDDYLFSQLTELQYDSHAKDRLAEGNE